jgi:hypothetical protein
MIRLQFSNEILERGRTYAFAMLPKSSSSIASDAVSPAAAASGVAMLPATLSA